MASLYDKEHVPEDDFDIQLGGRSQGRKLDRDHPAGREDFGDARGELGLLDRSFSSTHVPGLEENPCERFLLQNKVADLADHVDALERINGKLRLELAEQKALVEVQAQELLAKEVSLKAVEDKLHQALKQAVENNKHKLDVRAAIREAGMKYEAELDFLRATIDTLKPQKADLAAENKRLLQELHDCKTELMTAKMEQHSLNTLDLNSVPGATVFDELDRVKAAHYAEKLQLTDELRNTQARLKEAQEKLLEKSSELASAVTSSELASQLPDGRVEELKSKVRLLEDCLTTKATAMRNVNGKLEESNAATVYMEEKIRHAEARVEEYKRQRDLAMARLETAANVQQECNSLLEQLKKKDEKLVDLEFQLAVWKGHAEEYKADLEAATAREDQNGEVHAHELDVERAVKQDAIMKTKVYAAAVKKMKTVVEQKNAKVDHLKRQLEEMKAKLDNSVPKETFTRLQMEVNRLQTQIGAFGDALFMRGDELDKLLE